MYILLNKNLFYLLNPHIVCFITESCLNVLQFFQFQEMTLQKGFVKLNR